MYKSEKYDAYLGERVRFNLRELVLHIIGVHRLDLLACRCAQHLDNLNQLVDPTLSREKRLAQHQLGHHAPRAPDINVRRVVRRAKDELGRSVVARADVRDVGLAGDEDLGGAEVAEFEDPRGWVEEQVLRLDVSVADADGVDVGE